MLGSEEMDIKKEAYKNENLVVIFGFLIDTRLVNADEVISYPTHFLQFPNALYFLDHSSSSLTKKTPHPNRFCYMYEDQSFVIFSVIHLIFIPS
ncbi:hypothetical protein V6N13_086905 [Hibiscus sabdariffa]